MEYKKVMLINDQQGIKSMNHLITLKGSSTNRTAKFATAAQHMQHGHKQLSKLLSYFSQQ